MRVALKMFAKKEVKWLLSQKFVVLFVQMLTLSVVQKVLKIKFLTLSH